MNELEKLLAEMESILAKDSLIDALVKDEILIKIDKLRNLSREEKKSTKELVKEGFEIFSTLLGVITNIASLLSNF